jgi:hypothetical protein
MNSKTPVAAGKLEDIMVLEQPYQGLMEEALAGMDKINGQYGENSVEDTNCEEWEAGSRDILINNDAVFREWVDG